MPVSIGTALRLTVTTDHPVYLQWPDELQDDAVRVAVRLPRRNEHVFAVIQSRLLAGGQNDSVVVGCDVLVGGQICAQ